MFARLSPSPSRRKSTVRRAPARKPYARKPTLERLEDRSLLAFTGLSPLASWAGENSGPNSAAAWIDVQSLAFGTQSAASTSASRSSVRIEDVSIVKQTCSSTPNLMQSCLQGEAKQVKIEFTKADKPTNFITWTFQETLISSYQISGHGGGSDMPTESVSFNFHSLQLDYKGGVHLASADANDDSASDVVTVAGSGSEESPADPAACATGEHLTEGLGNPSTSDDLSLPEPTQPAAPDQPMESLSLNFTTPLPDAIFDNAALASTFLTQPGFRGGVSVAVGDVNGDATADIITSPGPSATSPVDAPVVDHMFHELGTKASVDNDPQEDEVVSQDPKLPPNNSYGIDLDGDGDTDIIVVGTQGGASVNGTGNVDNDPNDSEVIVQDPNLPPNNSYGIDLDGDGDNDIIVVGTQGGAKAAGDADSVAPDSPPDESNFNNGETTLHATRTDITVDEGVPAVPQYRETDFNFIDQSMADEGNSWLSGLEPDGSLFDATSVATNGNVLANNTGSSYSNLNEYGRKRIEDLLHDIEVLRQAQEDLFFDPFGAKFDSLQEQIDRKFAEIEEILRGP